MKDPQPDGSYGTGMAIQLFFDVQARAGTSPALWAVDLIDQLKKRGTLVTECPRSEQEQFYRYCLELLEQQPVRGRPTEMHVLYSVMPAKTGNILVLTMYGAPQSEWVEQAPVIRVMSDFRMFGPGLKR
jgi:hypothetical protein